VQLSGSTGSEKQQVKTRLEINACKSYAEQIEHKKVKEFSGKSSDINLAFLRGKNVTKLYFYGRWTLTYS